MSNTQHLVFITIDPRITGGEHYTLISDYFAHFQHGLVSYLEGRSIDRRPNEDLTFRAVHDMAEWPIVDNAREGDRYIVITHGLGRTQHQHDHLMVSKHAEDLDWSLDDVVIVVSSKPEGGMRAMYEAGTQPYQRVPFAEYFHDLV